MSFNVFPALEHLSKRLNLGFSSARESDSRFALGRRPAMNAEAILE
jgi:hypothetical protein